jgi:hypothetical protein
VEKKQAFRIPKVVGNAVTRNASLYEYRLDPLYVVLPASAIIVPF